PTGELSARTTILNKTPTNEPNFETTIQNAPLTSESSAKITAQPETLTDESDCTWVKSSRRRKTITTKPYLRTKEHTKVTDLAKDALKQKQNNNTPDSSAL
ncbi:6745_t:CDS:2, partial [Racocetra persica]